jgi:hypothetical protein
MRRELAISPPPGRGDRSAPPTDDTAGYASISHETADITLQAGDLKRQAGDLKRQAGRLTLQAGGLNFRLAT